LSTLHFLKILENSLEVLKVLKNSLEVLKVIKNSLEVLKVLQMELQENSSIDEVNLNDLDNATLHIDGQSTEVNTPPAIIDVPDKDDDIIDDEDAFPHDLVDFDDEDLIDVDDDDVARSYGDDGGGEDRPLPHHVPTGCGGCFANRGKGKRKPNLGDRTAGRLHTRDKTRNLSLKEITDKKGLVSIRFEVRDKQTLMPLSNYATHWSSYIRKVIRGVPLYYSSWLKVSKERKAALITDIRTQFDLRSQMESPDWTEIDAGIQHHMQKAYNTNKAAFKAQHWVIDPRAGPEVFDARGEPNKICPHITKGTQFFRGLEPSQSS
nr:hypothetical protein [Tanacetum cinerariifolium]